MGNMYHTLTREEKTLVSTSWFRIRPDLTKCGANLFIILFTDYPKMGIYFPFKGPTEDSFERHINTFMGELDRLVRTIDDREELEDILTANVLNHVPRNIHRDDYLKLKSGALKMLRGQLGTEMFNKDMERAWDKSMSITFTYITEMTVKLKSLKGKTLE